MGGMRWTSWWRCGISNFGKDHVPKNLPPKRVVENDGVVPPRLFRSAL